MSKTCMNDGEKPMIKKWVDKKRYNRIAAIYDLLENPMELLSYSRWRKEVFTWVPKGGKILEVGVGTGKNLPYYYRNHEIFAVDVSENMLKRAKIIAEKSKALFLVLGWGFELGRKDKTLCRKHYRKCVEKRKPSRC